MVYQETNVVFWKKLPGTENGALFEPKYDYDAGLDLSVSEDVTIEPGEHVNVPCGIQVALPDGISALVIGRSSMVKNRLFVFTTLIDSGYRGPLYIFAYNHNPKPGVLERVWGRLQGKQPKNTITIKAGDRVAQLVPLRSYLWDAVHLVTAELPESARGGNGFGSTGK